MSDSHSFDELTKDFSEEDRALIDALEGDPSTISSSDDVPSWRAPGDIGSGAGPEAEYERCGKFGTPRQQFEHMGLTICVVCADERAAELGKKGRGPCDSYEPGLSLDKAAREQLHVLSGRAGLTFRTEVTQTANR